MTNRLFYLFFFTLFACSGNKDSDIAKIKLKEFEGQTIDLNQYQGKAVFINFWATWCKPCIQEMPTIERAQKLFADKDVVFLFASDEERERTDKFIKKHSYNFHYVHLENLEELKLQALPATFIFNPEGKLKFSESGYRQWDDPVNIQLITKIMNDHDK